MEVGEHLIMFGRTKLVGSAKYELIQLTSMELQVMLAPTISEQVLQL